MEAGRAVVGSSPVADLDGVLIVDKPVGLTSHDVVATARRTLGFGRIGHTGTLDPNASGVLVLVLGQATRLVSHLGAVDKEYEATIRFGVETDTYDTAGRVVRETGLTPSREAVEAALIPFRGPFAQVPPAYSAKSVDGERAYARARRGVSVELPAVPVVTRALELVAFDGGRATLRLVCSAGFYVRSLAHDLGIAVGAGAVLEALVRSRVGDFVSGDAVSLSVLATADRDLLAKHVVPLDRLLVELPGVPLTPEGARRARHGRDVGAGDWTTGALEPPPGTVRLIGPDGQMIGLAEPSKSAGFLHPVIVLR